MDQRWLGIYQVSSHLRGAHFDVDFSRFRIVTHNSRRESGRALQFRWTPANQTLQEMQVDEVSQMLKEASIQLCLMDRDRLSFIPIENDLKDEAVRIFNRYLIDNEKSITTLIDRDSGL